MTAREETSSIDPLDPLDPEQWHQLYLDCWLNGSAARILQKADSGELPLIMVDELDFKREYNLKPFKAKGAPSGIGASIDA